MNKNRDGLWLKAVGYTDVKSLDIFLDKVYCLVLCADIMCHVSCASLMTATVSFE